MTIPQVKLNSGASIPVIGLGVYKSPPGETTYQAVRSALELGYRHVDTAQIYRNEADVGRAVHDSGIPRAELFVTTKLWLSEWGYDSSTRAVDESLKRLGLDYVDLLLLHAPGNAGPSRTETWRAVEDAHKKGLIKSIGVSNFGIPHLEKLAETATVPPAVNQIELHPFLQRAELVDYCKAKGIAVEAYSPLAKASKWDDPVIQKVAKRRGKTPAQVMLRWAIQKSFIILPKSTSKQRQAENLDVFNFTLDDQDMGELDALEQYLVTGWDPIVSDEV